MSNFTLPLGIESLDITAQTLDSDGNIIFDVKSNKTSTTCRIRVVRYQCMDCDDHPTTSERYDWMERKAKTTKGFDRYINRQLIHSTVEDVAKKEKVSYDIIDSALHRNVNTRVDWTQYNDLTRIGMESLCARHEFLF